MLAASDGAAAKRSSVLARRRPSPGSDIYHLRVWAAAARVLVGRRHHRDRPGGVGHGGRQHGSRRGQAVRMLIIWNLDSTAWGDENDSVQGGYALVRPERDCPACIALGVAFQHS